MKKISKIILSLMVIGSMISIFAVNCFAWQTTNSEIKPSIFTGGQTYAITPIESAYFTRPRASGSNGFYSQSIQTQTVYNISTKSNYNGPRPLNTTLTEFQNNWNNLSLGYSPINTEDEYVLTSLGYTGLNADDKYNTKLPIKSNGTWQSNTIAFDKVTYETSAYLHYDIDKITTLYNFANFNISKSAIRNSNSPLLNIKYYVDTLTPDYIGDNYLYYSASIIQHYKSDDSIKTTNVIWNTYTPSNISEEYLDVDNYLLLCNRVECDILKELVLPNVDSLSDDIIEIRDLTIGVGYSEGGETGYFSYVPLVKTLLETTYYRPFATEGEGAVPLDYNDPKSIEEIDIFYKINQRWNKNNIDVDEDGFENLGNTIGNTVQGIFDIELLPNVTLFTILLIPLSFGILFVIIKFFAGG